MEKLIFTSVTEEARTDFHHLMQMYAKKLDEHQSRNADVEILKRWINSIIEKQFDIARYLKLCYVQSTVIRFIYGKIDQPEDKCFKKVGYGYVMEFYVLEKTMVSRCFDI